MRLRAFRYISVFILCVGAALAFAEKKKDWWIKVFLKVDPKCVAGTLYFEVGAIKTEARSPTKWVTFPFNETPETNDMAWQERFDYQKREYNLKTDVVVETRFYQYLLFSPV